MSWLKSLSKKSCRTSRQLSNRLGHSNGHLSGVFDGASVLRNLTMYSIPSCNFSTEGKKKFSVVKKGVETAKPAEPVVARVTPESIDMSNIAKIKQPEVDEKASFARIQMAKNETAKMAKAGSEKPDSAFSKLPGLKFFKSKAGKRVLYSVLILSVLFSYAGWYKRKLEREERVALEQEANSVIPAPATAFIHPLNSSGRIYTGLFYCIRMAQLFWAFTPLVLFALKCSLTGGYDESRRAEWLDILVRCIENAGCTFLKFGQWLSMRPDIFPLDVINVLARLRDDAPSHAYSETIHVVEDAYKADIHEIFEIFPETPIASGSIAQVYKCRLTDKWAEIANMRDSNGNLVKDVAVKVRHPKVMNQTWIDVDLLYKIVDFIPSLCIPFNREEFRDMVQNQIDFRWEAHYLSRFAYNFRQEIHQQFMDFPRVSTALITEPVLIESWAEGASVSSIFSEVGDMFRPLNDAAKLGNTDIVKTETGFLEFVGKKGKFFGKFLKDEFEEMCYYLLKSVGVNMDSLYKKEHIRLGEDKYVYDPSLSAEENNVRAKKKVLAFTLFDMFLKMFLRDNLIHGDLHAGNVLFNLKNHRATVLDAGMTVSLDDDIMSQFGMFLKAICEGDADALIKYVEAFEVNMPEFPRGSGNGLLKHNPTVKKAFTDNIHNIFERFYKKSIYGNEIPEQVSIGDVVGQVLLALEKEKLLIRGDVASAILSMSVIEGILRQLDPELDIILKSVVYFVKYKQVTDLGDIIKG